MSSQQAIPQTRQLPEERLMIAVLQDAVDCVEKYRSATDFRRRRLFDEATYWILQEESKWPFSFKGICEVVGLDANAVRHHLRLAQLP